MANYTVTITGKPITGTGARNVKINNTTYNSDATLSVAGGTTLTATSSYGDIFFNGIFVKNSGSYSCVINSDVTVDLGQYSNSSIYITEAVTPISSGGGQKTMVSGTAYEISEGNVLVGGTSYAIDNGKTLVNGTAYEIAFYKPPITVNITGKGNEVYTAVAINNVAHYAASTLEIPNGTSITAFGMAAETSDTGKITITLNGTTVASGKYTNKIKYTFTPDCTVVNIALKFGGTASSSTITITTS